MPSSPIRMVGAICLALFVAELSARASQTRAEQPSSPPPDGVATLLRRVQQGAAAGDGAAILALGDARISRPIFEEFAATLTSPVPTRVVVTERDRTPGEAGTLRLIVEIFIERGIEGRLGTWRMDVGPGDTAANPWRILSVSRLSVVTGLYRLALDTATEYDITNLVVRAPDLAVEMPSGRAFLSSVPDGTTAMVILGRGRMKFSPPDPAERTQVHILSGRDELAEDIDIAFLRFSPSQFDSIVDKNALKPRTVDSSDARNAVAIFNDLLPKSLTVDLADISRDRWSLTPSLGDVIAELRTRRFGTLTYARSTSEPEDISVFDRKRRRNISTYTSAAKLRLRGRFYSEDDRLDYDVLAYDIDVQLTPDRSTIDGDVRMKLRILVNGTSSLTLKIAETVTVRGVYSPDFGRLLHLRVVGQNSIIVNLPEVLAAGTELWLDVRYGGPVTPQAFDREAIQIGQAAPQQERVEIPLQPRYLYSNRSYWYPQSTVTDYATATVRVTVPSDYDVVATGQPVESPTLPPSGSDNRRRQTFVFEASRPVRYLALIVSRFNRLENGRISAGSSDVLLYLEGTPRAPVRVKEMTERTAGILSFYASLLGDAPYPSFTLALAESDRPGGHSPPYFAVLNTLVPGSTLVWRNDPVSFENFPSFFLAHELAHQWWGQAVGWKNYHEQWLSESFAQYFAVLYAEKDREGSLGGILRQMRRTAIEASPDGPVYLGYRLGHIQNDDRIFRAVVYNKGAMVLHMLRRLIGEDAFFGGIRAFYQEWKFKKAGTDDFRQVMERAAGRNLQRFFDVWVFGSEIPHIKFTSHVSSTDATARFEQLSQALVDVPITVTITYESGDVESVVVIVDDKQAERVIPLTGRVRSIAANADNGALVEINR